MRIFISFLIATVSARTLRSSVNSTASPPLDVVVSNTTSNPDSGDSTEYPWYTEYGNYTANTTSYPDSANSTEYPWYTEYGNYTTNTTSYPDSGNSTEYPWMMSKSTSYYGYGNDTEYPDFLGNR